MSNSTQPKGFPDPGSMMSYLRLSGLIELQDTITRHECEQDFLLIHQNMTNILLRMQRSIERFMSLNRFERTKKIWFDFFKRQRKLWFKCIDTLDIHASDFTEQEFEEFLSDLPFEYDFQNPVFVHINSLWFDGAQEQIIGDIEQEESQAIEELFESEDLTIRGDDKLLLQFRNLKVLMTQRFPKAYRKLMK